MKPNQRKELLDSLWTTNFDSLKRELWYHDETGAAVQSGHVIKNVLTPRPRYTVTISDGYTVYCASLDGDGYIKEADEWEINNPAAKRKLYSKHLDNLLEDYIERHENFVAAIDEINERPNREIPRNTTGGTSHANTTR